MAEDWNIELGRGWFKMRCTCNFFVFVSANTRAKSDQVSANDMLYQGATRKVAVKTVLHGINRRAAVELTYY